MNKLVKIVATIAITAMVVVPNIAAYQTAAGAIQVTFKNGTNIYADINEGISVWK